jgi:hypothetical protein
MPIDYKTYHPEWKKVIVPSIRTRSFGYCEFCNIKNKLIVIRGEYGDKEVYQDEDGFIWDANTSEYLGGDYLGTVGNKPFVQVVLTVAHMDHDINNNDYSNLRDLCQRCHNRYDRENRNKNRKEKKLTKQPELF